jgi:hypothetical protein
MCFSFAAFLRNTSEKLILLPILTSGGRANDNPGVEFKSKEVVPGCLWSSIIILHLHYVQDDQ